MRAYLIGTILALFPSGAFAQLVLYDNFNNAAGSNSLWTKDVAGAGSVTFNGSQAIIDMSSSSANKAARMLFPVTPTLAGLGGSLEITWDQQIVTDGANGFDAGFGLISGSTVFDAGQRGAASGNASFDPHHFLISNGNYDTITGDLNKHHFDLTITPTTSTLNVYQYNAAFDSTPGSYVSSGTLLTTLASTPDISVTSTAPMQLMFFSELEQGSDPFSSFNVRQAISIDNVFTNLPEPGGFAALMIIGGLSTRRRRSGSDGEFTAIKKVP